MGDPLVIPVEHPDSAARAAEVLDAGGVAALPTDTVYGLMARGSRPAAVERIFAIKGRPPEKDLPFLIADRDAIYNFVNVVPGPAARLAAAFWPGPLTLVLGPDPGVALRLPDHPWLRSVLRLAGGPVRATSANLSGEPPLLDASGIVAAFPAGLDLVVDERRPGSGAPSTVVRIPDLGPGRILREGALPRAALDGAMAFRIAFVCTGNTCRSPMAAAVLAHEVRRLLPGEEAGLWRISSFGARAGPGSPLSRGAREALSAAGIPPPPSHRSQPAGPDAVAAADLILTMGPEHREDLRARFPEAAPKIRCLDPEGAVEDPFGGDRAVYDSCLARIRHLVLRQLLQAACSLDGP